jgi:hypothetical protein
MSERIWLDVPFSEKDVAKAAGARWDVAARRWYAPRAGVTALERWTAESPVPDPLPGEDRGFGSGLFVDLVPSSCWFTNVRSCVSEGDWERLRRMITTRADQRCEICGAEEDRDRRRWLEAHERWSYDDKDRRQTLRRLICLCTDCHTVTHFGLATVKGTDAAALAHLMAVTRMSRSEAEAHVRQAFRTWSARSGVSWSLDLTMLTSAGVTLRRPPDASQRAQQAASTRAAGGPGVPNR